MKPSLSIRIEFSGFSRPLSLPIPVYMNEE